MAAIRNKNIAKTTKINSRTVKNRKRASWPGNLSIGYATYDHEEDYISPIADAELSHAQRDLLEKFHQRMAVAPVFVDDVA